MNLEFVLKKKYFSKIAGKCRALSVHIHTRRAVGERGEGQWLQGDVNRVQLHPFGSTLRVVRFHGYR